MARKANTQQVITKTCTKTGETYTGTVDELAEFFYRDRSQKDGLSPWSKAAERAYNKAYYNALKKTKAQKKAAIEDEANLATFERTMKAERVVRKAKKDGTRTAQAKARTTARRKRQNRQNALKASNSA